VDKKLAKETHMDKKLAKGKYIRGMAAKD